MANVRSQWLHATVEVCVFVGLPAHQRGEWDLKRPYIKQLSFMMGDLYIDRREIQDLPGCLGLAVTYSPTPEDAVPSAQRHLTAGFGMEPGVLLVL